MNQLQWKTSKNQVPYPQAMSSMEQRVANIIKNQEPELVWLLEHPPLYTAGTSAKENDLLEKNKFDVFTTGRGGQYTYHGPGQRVAYVMLNLKKRNSQDVRLYVHNLEQVIINSLHCFDIDGQRREGRVGIWVEDNHSENKIAAIGIRIRKWVTYHGAAVNINPDLSHFSGIIPCGIAQHGVTSMHELGKKISHQEFDSIFKQEFIKIFPLN